MPDDTRDTALVPPAPGERSGRERPSWAAARRAAETLAGAFRASPEGTRRALGLVLLGAVVAISAGPRRMRLDAPRLGIPAVPAPGDSFAVELSSSDPLWDPSIQLALVDGARRIDLDVRVEDGRGARRRLVATVPQTAPTGPYDLEARLGTTRSSRVLTRPRAVHVTQPRAELLIAQIADLPSFAPDGSGSSDGDRRMAALVEELLLVDPDLVLVSGDVAYGGTRAQFDVLFDALLSFEVPVVVAPGNHEYDGWAYQLETFGAPWHVVDAHGLRIVSLNTGHGRDQLTHTQLAFLRRALDERDGRTPIVQLHHPVFAERSMQVGRDELVRLCRQHGVPVVLSGHLHADRAFDASGSQRTDRADFPTPRFYVTTAAGADLRPWMGSSPKHWGYRLIRLTDGKLVSATYDWDGAGWRSPSGSVPSGLLTVERLEPSSARVRNDSNEDLIDGRLRLVDPDGRRDRRAGSARVVSVARIPSGAGGGTEYTLSIDVPAHSELLVALSAPSAVDAP